jgi:hypothetical protein
MQNAAYNQTALDCKPSITEVIEKYLDLRKGGREQVGLCPFHADKNPSLSVNEEKGLFHCFGCGAGGDVIRFIELIEKIPFKEACARLRLKTINPKPRPFRNQADKIAAWARDTSIKVREALCEISDQVYICSVARKVTDSDKDLIRERELSLIRQWAILCDLDDDLNNPTCVLEIWARRDDIGKLLESIA